MIKLWAGGVTAPRPVSHLHPQATMDSIQEQWRPVTGYEGLYEVSDQGRVRGLDRFDTRGRHVQGVVLRAHQTGKHKYYAVTLSDSTGRKTRHSVHRLVLEAFVGSCPDGMEACHGEGGWADNRLGNLRWGTKSENCMDDKLRDGRLLRGEQVGTSKLTAGQVLAIRADSRLQKDIALAYGVSKMLVSKIKRRIVWAWLEG